MAHDPWFDHAIKILSDAKDQKVWSLIVSVFGDLAQQPGDHLGSSLIGQIIAPLGIRSDAMRVALHRLRKDGWIESHREGRNSLHTLTEHGRALSAAVTPRIYDRAPTVPDTWRFVTADDTIGVRAFGEALRDSAYVGIGRNMALGTGPLPPAADHFMTFTARPDRIPEWARSRLFPDDLILTCQTLHCDTAEALASRPTEIDLSPLQIATLRTLIVHRWRKVVLRWPALPDAFQPADWPGSQCRAQVFRLLDDLPCPSLNALRGESV